MEKQPFSQTAIGYVLLGVFVTLLGGLLLKWLDLQIFTQSQLSTTKSSVIAPSSPTPDSTTARSEDRLPDSSSTVTSVLSQSVAAPTTVDLPAEAAPDRETSLQSAQPKVPAQMPTTKTKAAAESRGTGTSVESSQEDERDSGEATLAGSRSSKRDDESEPATASVSKNKSSKPSTPKDSREEREAAEEAKLELPPRCYTPTLDDYDFYTALRSITAQSFLPSKFNVAKQVIRSHCLFAGQVKEIIRSVDFLPYKIEIAKYAWPRTVDRQNYYIINDALDFAPYVDELGQFISRNP